VERFARDRHAPVLIEGESGTGKTTIARYLHQHSPRASGPYHSVVLSTLDDSLASSELFGHVAGAFTDARRNRAGHFVSAAGGTLFLDEIGKASRAIQQKLLHAVEYGEIRPVGSDRDMRVDVRSVFASNVPVHELVARDEFLPDLFARISAFRVVLPPLRERRADIPLLLSAYVAKHAAGSGYSTQVPDLDPELVSALQAAPWPNNLRQLDATIHRLLVDAEGTRTIGLEHCIDDLSYLRGVTAPYEALSAERVDVALRRAGSVSGAARLLGVDRTTVHRFQRRRSTGLRSGDVTVARQVVGDSSSAAPHSAEESMPA
jgi:DNA-binding NtrC family response regulator